MEENKTIVKNTIVIYIKVILSVLIGLYTSRQVLLALGASDYGLFGVVGGVVSLMNLIGITMISTTCRYIAVEMGKPQGNINKVFNTIFIVHSALALLLLIIAESIGVYYINNYLNVGNSSLADAHFIFQISVISSCISVVCYPFLGLLISREKFVYTSVLEIISLIIKLGLVILLVVYAGNKLRLYAIIVASITISLNVGYYIYCYINERSIIKWSFNRSWKDYVGVFKFTWWLLLGATAVIGRIQGIALIINYFFGTVVNAAFALANTINEYIITFIKSMTQATTPQIMKSYGEGNVNRSVSLTYVISRLSFLMMLIPVVPFIFNAESLLSMWLVNPPEFTSIFTILFLINGLVWTLSAGFDSCIQASGDIKKNQIGYSIINLAVLPFSYVLYKFGCPPYANLIIMMVLTVITLFFQCYIMRMVSAFDFKTYILSVIIPALKSSVLIFLPLIVFDNFVYTGLFLSLLVCFIWTILWIYVLGLTANEKALIHSYVVKLLKK